MGSRGQRVVSSACGTQRFGRVSFFFFGCLHLGMGFVRLDYSVGYLRVVFVKDFSVVAGFSERLCLRRLG